MSPALAMFEAGLLRSKSTLSIFTQIYSGIIVLGVLWFVVGYSLTFGESAQVIGNPLQHALFIDVSYSEPSIHAPDIPAAAFAIFQMMFAVITPTTHHRLLRRAHAVQSVPRLLRRLLCTGVLPDRSLGVGPGLFDALGRARLRGRRSAESLTPLSVQPERS